MLFAVIDSAQKTLERSWQHDMLRIISRVMGALFLYIARFSSMSYDFSFAVSLKKRRFQNDSLPGEMKKSRGVPDHGGRCGLCRNETFVETFCII